MSGEFNIFKNLDDLKKTNLLDQIKALQSAKPNDLNTTQEDEDDFDELLNNAVKSPNKRQGKEPSFTPEKKAKKTTRRSSSSSERSISPVMPLIENLINKVNNRVNEENKPVGRRTRRSLEMAKKAALPAPPPIVLDEEQELDLMFGLAASSSNSRGRAKSRGGATRRGRGKGKNSASRTSSQMSFELENLQSFPSNSSSNGTTDQESDNSATQLSIMERFLQQGLNNHRTNKTVMRARRNFIAEQAARSTQVDFVDLVSSPWPRVEGMINLDSDNEDSPRQTRSQKQRADENSFVIDSSKPGAVTNASNIDVSFDDDNPEINVKITWKGKPEAFKLRKYQKFSTIFKDLAEREKTEIGNLVFNLNNRIVLPDDTPDSIDYKIFQFIDGRVLANSFSSPYGAVSKKRDANKIKLKIQSDKWKRPLQIELMKTDNFRILYIKCAEELNVGMDQLKLSFDGELLGLSDTPADLDLEGGEAIDLRIKN